MYDDVNGPDPFTAIAVFGFEIENNKKYTLIMFLYVGVNVEF